MRKLLLLLLTLIAVPAVSQSYNVNVGGISYSSGTTVPGSCPQDGYWFFKNTATTGWYQCVGGAFVAVPTSGGSPGTVTSVGWTINGGSSDGIFTVIGSPVTTSGTISVTTTGNLGGFAYFSTANTISSTALVTLNSPILGGGNAAAPKTATFLTTDGAQTLTVGIAGGGNGIFALSGNTSGTATFTAPATAGTRTNPVVVSNVLALPDGSTVSPSIQLASAGEGLFNNGGFFSFVQGSAIIFSLSNSTNLRMRSDGSLTFTATTDTTGTRDTGIGRQAAGVLSVDTGTTANGQGKVKAAGYMSVGTTFTSNAGCTDTSLVGGATAGKFSSGATGSCTTIVTMGNSATAPTGWACDVVDLTTFGGAFHQTTSSTTTATFTGTSVAADVIQFKCVGY